MSHVHHYRETPRGLEEGDDTRRCVCGQKPRSFTLPYIPLGSNALHRMHFHAVSRQRQQVRTDVALLAAVGPLITSARVTYDFRWRTRTRRDPHNYVEAMKPALDALVGRWLVDDDRVELVVRGTVGTGKPDQVTVTVEES